MAPSPRRPRDRGGAAVEFALVLPILLLLVFGILDYGRLFYDSIALRQGAREAARQAVVQLAAPSCSSQTTFGAKIACTAKAASGTTIGALAVYVPAPSPTWAQGNTLLVCMQSKETGTGLVPFPAGGIIRTSTYMSIEVGTAPPTSVTYQDPAPTGSDWSWCS